MTVFERIETLRKEKKISQAKLEKDLGFSNGSVSKWKTSTPTPERLKKLADYFSVSVDYLVSGKEEAVAQEEHIDLKAEFNRIKKLLESGENAPLYFDGQPADQESINLLLDQIKISVALMERMRKK